MYILKAIGIFALIFVAWIAAYGIAAVLVSCIGICALATVMRMEKEDAESRESGRTRHKNIT